MYGKTLRNSWKTPAGEPDVDMIALHEQMDVTTALDEEIMLARAWMTRYQAMLAEGKEWIAPHHGGGAPLSVHYLLDLCTNRLRRLVHTQNEIKPGSDMGSNLRVSISFHAGNGDVTVKLGRPPVPDLTENEPEEYAPELSESTGEPDSPQRKSGYEDDGDPDP